MVCRGKGLDKFREMMINRTDILYIKHYDDACKIFGNLVDIKGGVNYFLIDKDYNGLCDYNGSKVKFNTFDVILDSKYYDIVNKFLDYNKITDIYLGRYFGIESNDKNLTDNNNLIKCYVSQQKGFIKYIDTKFIKKEYNFYKVITTEASFKGSSGFGNTFIGNSNEIHTGSYISFKVSNENEAKSLLSYMKCKLPNFMLSLRKISQHINEATCKWIPLPPLDREWNDEDVYTYFNLLENEIKLIKETKISGYYDIKPINENELKIIKDGRKQYYLIDTKLYKIKKDKTQGDLFGSYIDGKIIEGFNNIELSDKNIIIPKVAKNKKITIDKDIKKKEIKEENLTIEDIKESDSTKEDNIIIEDVKPKVKSIKKVKVKKETEIKIENIEETEIKIDNIIIETENPKEVKAVKKIKVKKEDNIIIEEDKPKIKTIKKVKSKKETNEI